jgi:hypothetical protein
MHVVELNENYVLDLAAGGTQQACRIGRRRRAGHNGPDHQSKQSMTDRFKSPHSELPPFRPLRVGELLAKQRWPRFGSAVFLTKFGDQGVTDCSSCG